MRITAPQSARFFGLNSADRLCLRKAATFYAGRSSDCGAPCYNCKSAAMNQRHSSDRIAHRSRTVSALAIGVACLLLSPPLPAIGQADIKWQIMELTEQIAKQPRNAELFCNRGDLYRAQQNWDAAQADYDRGLAINPKADIVDFLRGRMFLEANWPFSAKIALDRFLSKQTNHLEAL